MKQCNFQKQTVGTVFKKLATRICEINNSHFILYYTVGHKKHTKMCFAITFVKVHGI